MCACMKVCMWTCARVCMCEGVMDGVGGMVWLDIGLQTVCQECLYRRSAYSSKGLVCLCALRVVWLCSPKAYNRL